MRVFKSLGDPQVARMLNDGKIGVIPTDTLYGIVASAANFDAVERLYAVRKRNLAKPCIVLIGDIDQIIDKTNWRPPDHHAIEQYWPGPVSIVVPTSELTPEYLHRGKGGLAYRLPDSEPLRHLLFETGPLIAPSANPEGQKPATNLAEAQAYFGENVDFYVDGGEISNNLPSRLITVRNDGIVEFVR